MAPQAASPVSYPALSNGSYTYSPDGRGGVNYFLNGQPIQNNQFAIGTNKDIASIEQYAKELYDYQNFNQGSQVNQKNTLLNAFNENTNQNIPQYTQSEGGQSPITYLGQTYDLSDPDQRQQYYSAVQSNLGGARDQQLAGLDRSINQSTGQINQNITNTNQSAGNYGKSFLNNLFDLGQNYDVGQVNNAQKFAGLGPNAFQSSFATSGQYGTDQYNRGLNDLGSQLNQAVGSGYLTNGQIDPNSAYGQQLGGYNQQLGDLNYQGGLQRQNINSAYQSGLDQAASGLQVQDVYQGMNPFQYNTQTYNPYSPQNINLGQYTPYNSSFTQYNNQQPSQPANGNPLSNILGFNPSQSQSNYYNAFVNRTPSIPSQS